MVSVLSKLINKTIKASGKTSRVISYFFFKSQQARLQFSSFKLIKCQYSLTFGFCLVLFPDPGFSFSKQSKHLRPKQPAGLNVNRKQIWFGVCLLGVTQNFTFLYQNTYCYSYLTTSTYSGISHSTPQHQISAIKYVCTVYLLRPKHPVQVIGVFANYTDVQREGTVSRITKPDHAEITGGGFDSQIKKWETQRQLSEEARSLMKHCQTKMTSYAQDNKWVFALNK